MKTKLTQYQREVSEFASIIGRELGPLHVGTDRASLVDELIERADTCQRLAVVYCNRELTQAEQRQDEKNDERIKELAKALGCGVVLQGDPRGACVKLKLPSGYTNDWGGTGVTVPTHEW